MLRQDLLTGIDEPKAIESIVIRGAGKHLLDQSTDLLHTPPTETRMLHLIQ
jgi:hypothetical protein